MPPGSARLSSPDPAATGPTGTDRPARQHSGPERAKVLSVRLTADEFDRLTDQAEVLGIGPSTLARTLIRQGLSTPNAQEGAATPPGSPLEAHLLAELTARVEALERWAREH